MRSNDTTQNSTYNLDSLDKTKFSEIELPEKNSILRIPFLFSSVQFSTVISLCNVQLAIALSISSLNYRLVPWFKITWSVAKSPRVAEQCDSLYSLAIITCFKE
ncbi:UNVERIFIED_CONTAM: hypothetical protein NCL1_32398 [Trichonephila clavipes]